MNVETKYSIGDYVTYKDSWSHRISRGIINGIYFDEKGYYYGIRPFGIDRGGTFEESEISRMKYPENGDKYYTIGFDPVKNEFFVKDILWANCEFDRKLYATSLYLDDEDLAKHYCDVYNKNIEKVKFDL